MKKLLPVLLLCAGCTTATQSVKTTIEKHDDKSNPTLVTAVETRETTVKITAILGGKQTIEAANASQTPSGGQKAGAAGAAQDASSEVMIKAMDAISALAKAVPQK